MLWIQSHFSLILLVLHLETLVSCYFYSISNPNSWQALGSSAALRNPWQSRASPHELLSSKAAYHAIAKGGFVHIPTPAQFSKDQESKTETKVSNFACSAPPHSTGSALLRAPLCSKADVVSMVHLLYCCLGLGHWGTRCSHLLLLKTAPKKNPAPWALWGHSVGTWTYSPREHPSPVAFCSSHKVFILHYIHSSIVQQLCQHPASLCSQVCCKAPHSRAVSCSNPSSFTALELQLIHTVELITLSASWPALCMQLINTEGKYQTCHCFASFSFCAGLPWDQHVPLAGRTAS